MTNDVKNPPSPGWKFYASVPFTVIFLVAVTWFAIAHSQYYAQVKNIAADYWHVLLLLFGAVSLGGIKGGKRGSNVFGSVNYFVSIVSLTIIVAAVDLFFYYGQSSVTVRLVLPSSVESSDLPKAQVALRQGSTGQIAFSEIDARTPVSIKIPEPDSFYTIYLSRCPDGWTGDTIPRQKFGMVGENSIDIHLIQTKRYIHFRLIPAGTHISLSAPTGLIDLVDRDSCQLSNGHYNYHAEFAGFTPSDGRFEVATASNNWIEVRLEQQIGKVRFTADRGIEGASIPVEDFSGVVNSDADTKTYTVSDSQQELELPVGYYSIKVQAQYAFHGTTVRVKGSKAFHVEHGQAVQVIQVSLH
jgi:hypothetical protein